MKIALICDSLLLDRSLEMYLKDYLTSYKLCDFVVATQIVDSKKPVFLIGNYENANLNIPFTKEILIKELELFYQKIKSESQSIETKIETQNEFEIPQVLAQIPNPLPQTQEIPQNLATDSTLNAKIEAILRRFTKEIESVILEHLKKD